MLTSVLFFFSFPFPGLCLLSWLANLSSHLYEASLLNCINQDSNFTLYDVHQESTTYSLTFDLIKIVVLIVSRNMSLFLTINSLLRKIQTYG